MDLLAIFGIGALIRLLRRRGRDQGNPPHSVIASAPISPTTPLSPRTVSSQQRLLRCAVRGMALAGLLVVAALEPWPTAWVMSAMLLPYVRNYKSWVLNNVDVVTVGAVAVALLEPLLFLVVRGLHTLSCRLLRNLRTTPRAISQIAQILWLIVTLIYWRARCGWLRKHGERASTAV